MVNFCAVCSCCTQTDIVREHLEDTLRICDVSAMGLYVTGMRNRTFVPIKNLTRKSCQENLLVRNRRNVSFVVLFVELSSNLLRIHYSIGDKT